MLISIFSLVSLLNCASMLAFPQPIGFSKHESLSTRQVSAGGTKNMTMTGKSSMTRMGMTEAEKEAREEAAEKLPGLNTIASAYKELYYHDKYGSPRNDTSALVRMAGQAVSTSAPSGDPEMVGKAILAVYEPYNAKIAANSSSRNLTKSVPLMEGSSLNSIAHALHEIWEKMAEGTVAKVDTSMLVQTIGQAIATSSPSGDPSTIVKAIELAAAKVMST